MSQPADHDRPRSYPERSGTVVETDEDIRQALISGLMGQPQAAAPISPAAAARTAVEPAAEPARGASAYRPTIRPPVPILTVFDDGKADGEVIRIREPKFTIGRSEGHLRFPLDGRMSSRHVEITHQVVGGLNRWVVTDLQSTHGLFVRVTRTVLADKAEILVGNGRYRFDGNQPDTGMTADLVPGPAGHGSTQGWADEPGPFRPPALTELLGREIGNRILLVKGEYWIGSDPSCTIHRSDDPFCEPRHVRLARSSKGGWVAEHNKTQNGLWLRMPQITVDATIQFQVGEQRFRLKVQ
ncbi:FHA domain-containing protein [Tundrisphaera sp. TA3]|uniref:FHA domain-containing protein n=1 Tax=Tundrisphaera sp. TA3 TaxID=3435775 RepID=UPI003EBA0D2C